MPASLQIYDLPLLSIDPDPDDAWSRLFRCEHGSGLHVGKVRRYRFNDPDVAYGVLYRSRHDPSRFSLALFDRASGAATEMLQGGLLEPRNRALLASILRTYQVALLP